MYGFVEEKGVNGSYGKRPNPVKVYPAQGESGGWRPLQVARLLPDAPNGLDAAWGVRYHTRVQRRAL